MKDEHHNQILAIVKKINALWARTGDECPFCGHKVERMEQIGRCVYSRPCGCRQGQGRVPDVWKEVGQADTDEGDGWD